MSLGRGCCRVWEQTQNRWPWPGPARTGYLVVEDSGHRSRCCTLPTPSACLQCHPVRTAVCPRTSRTHSRTTPRKQTIPRRRTRRQPTMRTKSRTRAPSGAARVPPSKPSSWRRSRPPSPPRPSPRATSESSWRRRLASTCVSSRCGRLGHPPIPLAQPCSVLSWEAQRSLAPSFIGI